MQEIAGTGVQKNGSRCSRLISQNLEYLAEAEGSLFTKGPESGAKTRGYRQQSSREGPCKLGAAFLQFGQN